MLVAGGGPAGSAAALCLARAGLSVHVLEASEFAAQRLGEAAPPGLLATLDELGAGGSFRRAGHLPAAGVGAAWGGPDLAVTDAFLDPRGRGWHLDRRRFDRDLAAAAAQAGARVETRVRGVAVAGGPGAWRVTAATPAGERWLAARFLIDATGRGALLARRLGAGKRPLDRLVAVAGWLPRLPGGAGAAHTVVEAVQEGWWYAAPVPVGAVVCFVSDSDLVRRGGFAQPGPWRAALLATRHVRSFATGAPAGLRPRVRPAASHVLEPPAGPGWIAAGDAACALDPLSSAGLLLALRSGAEAAGAACAALAGDAEAPRAYAARIAARWRRYLAERPAVYALERRWPASEFWRRRAGAPPSPPGVRAVKAFDG